MARLGPPNLRVERSWWDQGAEIVVGMDEVGRGAWAGPITVGAVVLPREGRVNRIRDSKMLSEADREKLYGRILGWVTHYGVGHATNRECDELGMTEAQRIAARRALDQLGVDADHVLMDGNWDFVGGRNTTTIVRGDQGCLSIATASIVAKVTRDRIMRAESDHHPSYGFDTNKGYPSPHHRATLAALGPSTLHRRSWVWMESLPWGGVPRHDRTEHLAPRLF